MSSGTGGSTTYKRADKLTVGIAKNSLSIEKAFLDLTTKAINYRGMLVNTMDIKVAYGALISGSFGLSGNDYQAVDAAADFQTYQRYITDPATTNSLNGSVDMPFLTTDATGEFDTNSFCIQSLDLSLANNLAPQNCIGKSAPENYTPGTAQITISLSSYLKDSNWGMLAKKLSQASIAIGFQVKNPGGSYAFWMPAVQLAFPDPASAGANQDISMAMKGEAKVGDDGSSALSIFRLPAA